MKIYCNTKSEFLNKINDKLDFIIFSPQICKHGVAKVSFGSNYFCRMDNANFGAFFCTIAIELLFRSRCSAHGFRGIIRQEIVIVNEIVIQDTEKLFF